MPKTYLALFSFVFMLLQSLPASARYAAIVIDADTGRVIHENEAAQRWYPASLTKVMTLYMTFQALESGRLRLHDMLTVSQHASIQPSSKLGLRRGQIISVENAIMAVTTRSANDAAVLLAETLGGSEAHFASMMTQEAQRLGMFSSSFQNASGLPDEGQISSARDLAILSAALIRDFPQYYPFFSSTEFRYKGRVLPNTNRILKSYPDADGLKTGFTCGSGYNLIASAKRGGHRLIGVLLGAHSSAERFEQMGNLLDIGFEKSSLPGSIHVSQLSDDDFAPPPFQLSSNRCAGSAMQMGADAGSSQHEAIHLKPRETHHRIAKNRTTGSSCRHSKNRCQYQTQADARGSGSISRHRSAAANRHTRHQRHIGVTNAAYQPAPRRSKSVLQTHASQKSAVDRSIARKNLKRTSHTEASPSKRTSESITQ